MHTDSVPGLAEMTNAAFPVGTVVGGQPIQMATTPGSGTPPVKKKEKATPKVASTPDAEPKTASSVKVDESLSRSSTPSNEKPRLKHKQGNCKNKNSQLKIINIHKPQQLITQKWSCEKTCVNPCLLFGSFQFISNTVELYVAAFKYLAITLA